MANLQMFGDDYIARFLADNEGGAKCWSVTEERTHGYVLLGSQSPRMG
jgi:hypothetical protein